MSESTMFINSPEDVRIITNGMEWAPEPPRLETYEPLADVRTIIDAACIQCREGNVVTAEAGISMLTQMGTCVIDWFDQQGKSLNMVAFSELIYQKHQAYGPGPIVKWGWYGLMIRLDTKVERYYNLIENPQADPGDESIDDTVKDILGYCVVGIAGFESGQL